jgi:hypothetical protein
MAISIAQHILLRHWSFLTLYNNHKDIFVGDIQEAINQYPQPFNSPTPLTDDNIIELAIDLLNASDLVINKILSKPSLMNSKIDEIIEALACHIVHSNRRSF